MVHKSGNHQLRLVVENSIIYIQGFFTSQVVGLGISEPSTVSPLKTNTLKPNKWRFTRWFSLSGWWFQIFCIFIPIWGHAPNWLIFFKGVETTNQLSIGWFLGSNTVNFPNKTHLTCRIDRTDPSRRHGNTNWQNAASPKPWHNVVKRCPSWRRRRGWFSTGFLRKIHRCIH